MWLIDIKSSPLVSVALLYSVWKKAFITRSQMSSINVYSFVMLDECVFRMLYFILYIYPR